MRTARIVSTIAAAGALTLSGVVPGAAADFSTTVLIQDRCDPVTFDAALHNPNACAPTTEEPVAFSRFFGRLVDDPAGVLREQQSSGWRFHSDTVTLPAGQPLMIRSTGGEVHTFTQVPDFAAGGCVPELNGVFGLDANAQCAKAKTVPAFLDPAFSPVFPGQTQMVTFAGAGTYRFQCMVHPWMRATVTVQ